MNQDQIIELAIKAFQEKSYEFELFKDAIAGYFLKNPKVSENIHSVKSRLKDFEHLREKIIRNWNDDDPITPDNLFDKITDLAGVRILHLSQDQFASIHEAIIAKVESKDWFINEQPIAYTWDPESVAFFKKFNLEVERKESFYTSIHYLIRPRKDSFICCEIQVRTLFEEIWGEVDHMLNYPTSTENLACREQILVLAKLVCAGSRLVDAIFRIYKELNGCMVQS